MKEMNGGIIQLVPVWFKCKYLFGSKHVRKHRKQASITDAETHTVLPEHLEFTQQLIRARS